MFSPVSMRELELKESTLETLYEERDWGVGDGRLEELEAGKQDWATDCPISNLDSEKRRSRPVSPNGTLHSVSK